MHFCLLLLTKDFPSNQKIESILEPFMDGNRYRSPNKAIRWDYWALGGRYGGKVQLKVDENDETYKWHFLINEARAGRLFRSNALEAIKADQDKFGFNSHVRFISEELLCYYMGFRDKRIYVDGAKIKDILNVGDLFEQNWGFITDDGRAYARDVYVDDDLLDFLDYDTKIQEAKEDYKDGWVCVVDIHD